MHFSPAALALSTTLALVSSVSYAQSDHVPSPQSAELVATGEQLEQAGDLDDAFGYYVSALAYDPHNADAFIAMGEVAEKQELYGSAIRYYTRALELAPNSAAALAGQGQAYVAKGAVTRAEANLQKLKLVCASPCEASESLAARIAAGPPERIVQQEELMSEATVEEAVEASGEPDASGVLIDEPQ